MRGRSSVRELEPPLEAFSRPSNIPPQGQTVCGVSRLVGGQTSPRVPPCGRCEQGRAEPFLPRALVEPPCPLPRGRKLRWHCSGRLRRAFWGNLLRSRPAHSRGSFASAAAVGEGPSSATSRRARHCPFVSFSCAEERRPPGRAPSGSWWQL